VPRRERTDRRVYALATALVLLLVAPSVSGPTWCGSVALAQAGCGVAALGDDPGEDGFQIDGQFYSGPAADDWAQGASFAGVLLDNGTPDPGHEPVLYVRDEDWSGGGIDCSTFQGGANSNNDDIGAGSEYPWIYGCGSAAQKYDLTDLYAHARTVEVDGSLNVWLVMGALTRSVQAEGYLDFEWNAAGIDEMPFARSSDGNLVGNGPHAGRTAGIDFIVSVNMSGGAPPEVMVRKWTDLGGLYEYTLVDPGPGNVFACADQAGAVAPPWGAVAPDGSVTMPPGTITPYAFVEVGVELTSIGIDPADLVSEQSTLIFKNRQSPSFTGYLVDYGLSPFRFVGPSAGVDAEQASGLNLLPPLPNPTRGGAGLRFDVPHGAGPVRLSIHDVSGRLVRELVNGQVEPGRRAAEWDGNDESGRRVSTGVYFVRLTAAGRSVTQKLVLLR
jgi:hypothetical protein